MTSAPIEYELKFEVDDEAFDKLKRPRSIDALGQTRSATRTLRSIYFDTEDLRLHGAGISMRVRKVGRNWIQTVKVGTALSGGISSPLEDEARVLTDAPTLQAVGDRTIRDRLRELINGRPLVPLFETHIRRTSRLVSGPVENSLELCLDQAEIRLDGQVYSFNEVEFEHKGGSIRGLFGAAKAVLDGAPCRISQYGKAERGYRHRQGLQCSDYAPRPAVAPRIAPDLSAELALRAMLRECGAQIGHNLACLATQDDPEGTHQLRIALRRLRTVLRFYRPLIGGDAAHQIDERARELGAITGRLRDADVLISDIVADLAADAPAGIRLEGLIDHLTAHRNRVCEQVIHALDDGVGIAFLLDLGAFTEGRAWIRQEDYGQAAQLSVPMARFAPMVLSKLWKRVEKRARNLGTLTIEERHAMRKDLKKVRYAVEFLAPLYGRKQVRKFLQRLKRLQNAFGYLNDVALAASLPDIVSEPGRRSSQIDVAVGYVLGCHTARAESAWKHTTDLWHEARAIKKFWD